MHAVIPIVFLLLLLSARRPASAQSWLVVPRRSTGGPPAQWILERRAALERAGVPDWAQRAILAHWARETGWGRAEWNWNVGNIRAFPGAWRGQVVWLTGRDGRLPYRAYRTLEEGVTDYVRLITRGRYRRAWDDFAQHRDPVRWYRDILAAGYSPLTDQAVREFSRIYERLPNA